ncbi:MAG: response regulator [Gammaproteobacteria bacterium]|jgi:twitching motility two-component system response regulator PilH
MATILIVEDSQTERQVLRKMLEKGGHLVIAATDGVEGIAMARQNNPELILMDVVMPGQNGFQTTRQLSRDPATQHIPIIIVTTKDQETDRVWAKRQGASDYLVKPVKEEELLPLIDGLLKERVS